MLACASVQTGRFWNGPHCSDAEWHEPWEDSYNCVCVCVCQNLWKRDVVTGSPEHSAAGWQVWSNYLRLPLPLLPHCGLALGQLNTNTHTPLNSASWSRKVRESVLVSPLWQVAKMKSKHVRVCLFPPWEIAKFSPNNKQEHYYLWNPVNIIVGSPALSRRTYSQIQTWLFDKDVPQDVKTLFTRNTQKEQRGRFGRSHSIYTGANITNERAERISPSACWWKRPIFFPPDVCKAKVRKQWGKST